MAVEDLAVVVLEYVSTVLSWGGCTRFSSSKLLSLDNVDGKDTNKGGAGVPEDSVDEGNLSVDVERLVVVNGRGFYRASSHCLRRGPSRVRRPRSGSA